MGERDRREIRRERFSLLLSSALREPAGPYIVVRMRFSHLGISRGETNERFPLSARGYPARFLSPLPSFPLS